LLTSERLSGNRKMILNMNSDIKFKKNLVYDYYSQKYAFTFNLE